MTIEIHSYETLAGEEEALARLWRETLGTEWPLDTDSLARIVVRGFAARLDGAVVALAALTRSDTSASLQLLLVSPELQGRGIGRALHDRCLAELSTDGVTYVRLGGMPGPYLWPGVPANLTDARALFERWGWSFRGQGFSLVRSLTDYRTPPEVAARGRGFSYRWATASDLEALLAFERAHFPDWARHFAVAPQVAVIAVDGRGAIVGSVLANDSTLPRLWQLALGPATGGFGALGVAERVRGSGVGSRLIAYACEQLRDRGVENCLVSWTERLSFYGRLGFAPWRSYDLAAPRPVPAGRP